MAFQPPSPDSLESEPSGFKPPPPESLESPAVKFTPPPPESLDQPDLDFIKPAGSSLLNPRKVPTSSEELGAQNAEGQEAFRKSQEWKVADNRQPSDNSYHRDPATKQILFDPGNMAKGLREAVADGELTKDQASLHLEEFQRGDTLYAKVQQLKKDAIGNQKLQAILHGTPIGAAFLASAVPGVAGGAAIGGPWAPVTGAVGGLITGTAGAWTAKKALDVLGDYSDFIKSVNASAELNPMYDAAGQLVAFGTSAPKSIANLAKLGSVAKAAQLADATAPSATRVVGSHMLKGGAGGVAFTGLQTAFNAGERALGINKDQPVLPSAQSLAVNVGLGVFLAGHGLEFKDYDGTQVGHILARGQVREQAGIPLDANDPGKVMGAFASINPGLEDAQKKGLLDPLTPDEQQVYAAVKQQIIGAKQQAQEQGLSITDFMAQQAKIPSFLKRGGRVITTAALKLEPTTTEENYAAPNVSNEGSVPVQPEGVVPIRKTLDEAKPGDSLPSPAGQPIPPEGVIPAPPKEEVAPTVAPEPSEVLFPTESLQVRGGSPTKWSDVTRVSKIVSDYGKEIYAVYYGDNYVGYSPNSVWELHPNYDGESKAYAKEFAAKRAKEVAPTVNPPDPNWRVTVNQPQVPGDKGFVQIDDVSGGVNKWSSDPIKLRAQGFNIPDFSKLPQGQYTLGQAQKLLESPSETPSAPLQPVVESTSTSGQPVTGAGGKPEIQWLKTPSVSPGGKPHFWNAYQGEAGKGMPFMRVSWDRVKAKWFVTDPNSLDANGRSKEVASFDKEKDAKSFVEKYQPTPVQPVTAAGGKEPWQKTEREYQAQGVGLPADHPLIKESSDASLELRAAEKQLLEESGFWKKTHIKDLATRRTTIGALNEFGAHTVETALRSPKVSKAAKDSYRAAKAKYEEIGVKAEAATNHRNLVEQAIREGKPVPPEVLADYPDLKPVEKTPQEIQPAAFNEVMQTALENGYKTEKAFTKDFEKNSLKKYNENQEEFLKRRVCSETVPVKRKVLAND